MRPFNNTLGLERKERTHRKCGSEGSSCNPRMKEGNRKEKKEGKACVK